LGVGDHYGLQGRVHSVPHREASPRTFVSTAQKEAVPAKKDKMALLGAITQFSPTPKGAGGGEVVSSIFLVDKKDGRYGPVINLTNLNSFVDVQHFKKEGIRMLRDLQGDFMAPGPKRRLLYCPSTGTVKSGKGIKST